MQLTLVIDFANPGELAEVAQVLNVYAASQEVLDAGDPDDPVVPPVTMEDAATALPAEEPKRRGRKSKPKPDTVSAGPAVLEQLKQSVAETAPSPDNVVPMKKPDVLEEAVFGDLPEPAPVAPADITTGQQLQEYILSLVHQKRLNPVAVKAKVYPKYNVVRSLDLAPEQVAAAKADIDAMLTDDKPKAANDLDL